MKKRRGKFVNEKPPGGLTTELARAVSDLSADEDTQSRYRELSDKRKLTPAEQEELEAIIRGNVLVGLLKAEARSTLSNAPRA